MTHEQLADAAIAYWTAAKTNPEEWRNWEYRFHGRTWWATFAGHPSFNAGNEYRRKPRTITVAGIEIPEPIRGEPEFDSPAWTFYPWNLPNVQEISWAGGEKQRSLLESGLLFSTKEAAIIAVQAIKKLFNPHGQT